MCENNQWLPLVTLVGLLTCAVPVKLKAEILHILAGFAKTSHIAVAIWQSMENAQVCCITRTSPCSAVRLPKKFVDEYTNFFSLFIYAKPQI